MSSNSLQKLNLQEKNIRKKYKKKYTNFQKLRIMSSSFKVEKISSAPSNSLSKTGFSKITDSQNSSNLVLGQIHFRIPTIAVMNYSSHALIEIIGLLFNNEGNTPPYAQIQRSLQILSYSMGDQILKSDLQELLKKNLHKRLDMYALFCLWSQYCPINEVIDRFADKKSQQKIIYNILLTYISGYSRQLVWYESLSLKKQIHRLVSMQMFITNPKIIEELESQISNLVISKYGHFQAILKKSIDLITKSARTQTSMNRMARIPVNFMKNIRNSQFMRQYVERYFFLQTQNKSQEQIQVFLNLFEQAQFSQAKQVVERTIWLLFDDKFGQTNKKRQFYGLVQNVILQQNTSKSKLFLAKILKNWFCSADLSKVWSFFSQNYQMYSLVASQMETKQINQKRHFLLNFFNALSRLNQTTQKGIYKLLYCRYFFHFFQSRPFNFGPEFSFLEIQGQVSSKNERQIIVKGLKNIRNEQFLNIMIFNKTNLPGCIDWQIDLSISQLSQKYKQVVLLSKLLKKFSTIWTQMAQKLLSQNKKIQLIYSVLVVQVDKKRVCLTFLQFAQLIKEYTTAKSFNLDIFTQRYFQKYYNPLPAKEIEGTKNKNQQGKTANTQKHPIIMEALIVKLMKRQLKKASVEQISKLISVPQQKTFEVVKKLTNKGYLQINEDGTYSYEA